jgi:hypothetical protein
MSNGRLLNLSSVKCLAVQMDQGDRGAIIAKLLTAFFGYYEPVIRGLICSTDFRRIKLATDVFLFVCFSTTDSHLRLIFNISVTSIKNYLFR